MTPLLARLFWIAVLLYAAFIAYSVVSSSLKGGSRGAAILLIAAFLLHTIVILARIFLTGHAPVVGNFENALLFAWVSSLAALIVSLRMPRLPLLPVVLSAASLLSLGAGGLSDPSPIPMGPAYRSPWLFVHVLFYLLAFASLAFAAGGGVSFLLNLRRSAGGGGPDGVSTHEPAGAAPREPGGSSASLRMERSLYLGLAMHGMGIAAGMIWAHFLWGHYWSWDPIETWAFVSFLTTGLVLHLRRSNLLSPRLLAAGSVISFAVFFASVFCVGFIESNLTYHSFQRIGS